MKNKKVSFLVLIAIFAVLFPFSIISLPMAEIADQSPDLQMIVFNTTTSYLYLDPVVSADVSDEGILISDFGGKITVLSGNLQRITQFSTLSTAQDAVYYDGAAISLQNNKIIIDTPGSRKTLTGSYDTFRLDRQSDALYAIDGNTLFEYEIKGLLRYVGDLIDESYYLTKETSLPSHLSGKISAFTVQSDYFFFAAVSQNNKNYDDIYCLNRSSGSMERMYERTIRIDAIVYLDGYIFTLSDGTVTKYRIFDDMLSSEKSLEANALTLNISGGKLYMATYNNNMIFCDSDLGECSILFQAEAADEGFFSSPTSAYTRRDSIFVADSLNDRLFTAGKNGQKSIGGFKRISSVVSDNLGNIYVSYDINKIAKLDSDFNILESVSLERAVKKLVIDINNNIYIVTTKGLYLLTKDYGTSLIENFETAKDVSFVMGSKSLIFYDGSNMYKNDSPLQAGSNSTLLFEKDNIVTFAADYAGNVFFTDTDGLLYKYSASDGLISPIIFTKLEHMDLKFITSIYISNIKNAYVDYGDLIFADTHRHCIYKLSKNVTGVTISDPGFVKPNIEQKNPLDSKVPLIYKVKESVEIFENPIEISGGQIIEAGKRIFYYDKFNSYEEFAFIIYEDTKTETLVFGYVFRNLLDLTSYEYTPPPAKQGVVYFDNTIVYRWPSVYATKLESLSRDREVTLCDFAAPIEGSNEYTIGNYVDDSGKIWYRISLGANNYGFIQADNISINKYVPPQTPKYNAQIKEYEGVKYAFLYNYDETSNSYTLIEDELPLPAGTRIEILKTPLDSQAEFTEIKFYREGLGTLTCYVKTVHIKYDTINTLQIVAIIALAIVIISAIILVSYYRHYKRKKETETENEIIPL